MPLKPVGCQVIEETQSAQPHRLRSRRASPAAEREAPRDEGSGEGERPNYKGTLGGGGVAIQRRHRMGIGELRW